MCCTLNTSVRTPRPRVACALTGDVLGQEFPPNALTLLTTLGERIPYCGNNDIGIVARTDNYILCDSLS